MTKCKLVCSCKDFSILSPVHTHPLAQVLMCGSCGGFVTAAGLESARKQAKAKTAVKPWKAHTSPEFVWKSYFNFGAKQNAKTTKFKIHTTQKAIASFYDDIKGMNEGGVNESTDESHEEAF